MCQLLKLIILLRINLFISDKNLVSKPPSTGETGTWKGGAVTSTETAAGRPRQVSLHPSAPHEGTRRRCDNHHHWDVIHTLPSCPPHFSSSQSHRPTVKVRQLTQLGWDLRYPAKSPFARLFLIGVSVTASIIKTISRERCQVALQDLKAVVTVAAVKNIRRIDLLLFVRLLQL